MKLFPLERGLPVKIKIFLLMVFSSLFCNITGHPENVNRKTAETRHLKNGKDQFFSEKSVNFIIFLFQGIDFFHEIEYN
jgi:hypothetical protein